MTQVNSLRLFLTNFKLYTATTFFFFNTHLGNLTEALKITYEHLDKNPHNDVALSNKITLEQEMAKHVEPEKVWPETGAVYEIE